MQMNYTITHISLLVLFQATNSRNATLTYSLVGGNVDYWIVGAQSGEIKAARLITYNLTPNGQGL